MMISIIKRHGNKICNAKIKSWLEKQGVIVSIGSARNTSSPQASHVLYAIGADEYVRAGTLRFSIGDSNTLQEVTRAADLLIDLLQKCSKKNIIV